VLEQGTVELMKQAGVGARMAAEGLPHGGFSLAFDGRTRRIDMVGLTGKEVLVYGQTELTRDLLESRGHSGSASFYNCSDVEPRDFSGKKPSIRFVCDGKIHVIECDFIAGCDGFHGVSRKSVPESSINVHEKAYPFGWLGLLADVPPVDEELIYSHHPSGFALCSMRSSTRSRYYIQCSLEERVEDWSDERFWDALRGRLPARVAEAIVTGPSFEKSIAPLRSYVAEPMRFGSLFLVGDAAHIVPPTGAKGLNLAASDVHYLFEGLCGHYLQRSDALLDTYSERALARVWKAERFSWWMTNMLHSFAENGSFDGRMQEAELAYLTGSVAAMTALSENYVGLPF
jgi:p-hydroxybenzoate 3-monooxygenase